MSWKQAKVKWTERMNSDLLECKRKAKDLISSVDPPRNATGRKKGYIEVMADLWEDKGARVPSPTGLASTIVTDQNKIKPNLPDYELFPSEIKNKTWGNIRHVSFCNIVNNVYDEIVYYRRNISNVPSSRAGKSFIEVLTFWIKQFNADSDLNSVALKVFMVLPTLILQKPSATSKSKEHSAAIERRLVLWKQLRRP